MSQYARTHPEEFASPETERTPTTPPSDPLMDYLRDQSPANAIRLAVADHHAVNLHPDWHFTATLLVATDQINAHAGLVARVAEMEALAREFLESVETAARLYPENTPMTAGIIDAAARARAVLAKGGAK